MIVLYWFLGCSFLAIEVETDVGGGLNRNDIDGLCNKDCTLPHKYVQAL